jgi:uncharacterized protein YjbJ (UPF0337 family)
MPNSKEINGKGDELKGKIKQKYAELADDDLLFEEGKEDETWGKFNRKLGRLKRKLNSYLINFSF